MRVAQPGNNTAASSELSSSRKLDKAAKPEKAQNSNGAAAKVVNTDAKTDISSKAKEMSQAKAVADGTPDVREEKIAELRKKISEGKYKVDANAIADRMVDDHASSGIG
jgi:negative regulator of flagellin synthesis FlgM